MVALAVPGVDVTDLVQAHRRHLVELMQRYTRLKEDVAEDEVAVALVIDAEIYRIDGLIRWLDSRRRPPAASAPSSRRCRAPAPRPGPRAAGPTRRQGART